MSATGALNLLRNLVANKDCEVKTVVDISEDRRNFVKSLYPGIITTDQNDDVFNDIELEAVVIATPVTSHFDLAMKTLESGKHVLVEKPMATTVGEVQQIRKLAEENGQPPVLGLVRTTRLSCWRIFNFLIPLDYSILLLLTILASG